MRILHLSAGKMFGGVENFQIAFARYRAACPELEPEFAVCFEADFAARLRQTGVPVHMLGEVRLRSPLSVLRARRRLADLLRRCRYDFAICHMPWPLVVFRRTLRRAGVPIVFWMHAPAESGWLDRLARWSPPDFALCANLFVARALPGLFKMPAEVLYVPVPPPPDLASQRDAVRAELATPSAATVVIQTTRMDPFKGHRLLLEALAQLCDDLTWICWIVGGPQRPFEAEYFAELTRYAGSLGIGGRVRFTGQRADVARLMAAADIYCQPNLSAEGVSIAFVEAMYAALPVIGTRIGGAGELIAPAGVPNEAPAEEPVEEED